MSVRVVLNTFPQVPGRPWGVTWLVDAPAMHPIWSQYCVNLCDLKTITDTPANIVLHGATHELLCWALEPNHKLDLDLHLTDQTVHFLTPPNFGYQFIADDNDKAQRRVQLLMDRVAAGQLSLDTDYRSHWDREFVDASRLANICDVCRKNPPIGVACSPFAAMSMAYCLNCLQKPADAEQIFAYLWEDVADFDLDRLNPFVFAYYTFKDNDYISFKEWVKKYGRTKEQAMADQLGR